MPNASSFESTRFANATAWPSAFRLQVLAAAASPLSCSRHRAPCDTPTTAAHAFIVERHLTACLGTIAGTTASPSSMGVAVTLSRNSLASAGAAARGNSARAVTVQRVRTAAPHKRLLVRPVACVLWLGIHHVSERLLVWGTPVRRLISRCKE